MTRALLRFAGSAAVPTVAFLVALALVPGHGRLAVRVYALALCALALLTLLRAIRDAHPAAGPSDFERALRPARVERHRLPELARLEREVSLARGSVFDLHFRLRPVLREIALGLLPARRGIELDSSPDAAREALGADLYELVRAERPPPPDRAAPGPSAAELQELVDALEAL